MLKTILISSFLTLMLVSTPTLAWQPDQTSGIELAVAQAMIRAKNSDPDIERWFKSAYAYAVFPRVAKGGIGIGAAYGKGIVIVGDETVGDTSLSQVTIGLQLGGQVYSEYIMFKDVTALNSFKRGNFELGAQLSAVALTAGASLDTSYDGGVAVFTVAEGGLMFEASVGGQQFKYSDR